MTNLRWDPRLKAWVASGAEEKPYRIAERAQVRKREDEFDAGLLVGVALGGFLCTLVTGLGYLLGQL
jgi:hypothetical protein